MVNVIVISGNSVVINGFQSVLGAHPMIVCKAAAVSGKEALQQIAATQYDVAIVSSKLPDRNGLELAKELKEVSPHLNVLIAGEDSEEHMGMLALKWGASGYISASTPSEQALIAVLRAAAARLYISNKMATMLAKKAEHVAEPVHNSLSERELSVFMRLAAGERLVDIAKELGINIKTVSTYRGRIMEKMGLETNAELTQYAHRHFLPVVRND